MIDAPETFESIEQERRRRILALLPEMERRAQMLRDVLNRAAAGEDVPWHDIDLARADLAAVLAVMVPPAGENED